MYILCLCIGFFQFLRKTGERQKNNIMLLTMPDLRWFYISEFYIVKFVTNRKNKTFHTIRAHIDTKKLGVFFFVLCEILIRFYMFIVIALLCFALLFSIFFSLVLWLRSLILMAFPLYSFLYFLIFTSSMILSICCAYSCWKITIRARYSYIR